VRTGQAEDRFELRVGERRPVSAESGDRISSRTAGGKVGEDLPEQAGELGRVPGAPAPTTT
jgi:hypothetical protein